jgi:hypothetical protein
VFSSLCIKENPSHTENSRAGQEPLPSRASTGLSGLFAQALTGKTADVTMYLSTGQGSTLLHSSCSFRLRRKEGRENSGRMYKCDDTFSSMGLEGPEMPFQSCTFQECDCVVTENYLVDRHHAKCL